MTYVADSSYKNMLGVERLLEATRFAVISIPILKILWFIYVVYP